MPLPSNKHTCVPLSGNTVNNNAATAAPLVCPIKRVVPSIPLAPPLLALGAEDIMVLLLGVWKSPNPAPQSAIRQIMSKSSG